MLALITGRVMGADCVTVSGPQIRGEDLGRADARFAAIPKTEFIAFAPHPGARRIVRTEDLARLAGRFGIDHSAFAPLCFEVETRVLNESVVADELRRSLKAETAEVADMTRFPVPIGDLAWDTANTSRNTDGTVLVRGRIAYAERRTFPVWARMKLQWRVRWLVARETIPAGTTITENMFTIEEGLRRERTAEPVASREEAIGKVSRRTIQSGAVIARTWLDTRRDIRRGQTVEVEARAGRARIGLVAKAESGGSRGERVVLLNEGTGRRFAARVVGPGQAVAGDVGGGGGPR